VGIPGHGSTNSCEVRTIYTREKKWDVGPLSSSWSRSMPVHSNEVHQQIFSERPRPMPRGQLGHVCPVCTGTPGFRICGASPFNEHPASPPGAVHSVQPVSNLARHAPMRGCAAEP